MFPALDHMVAVCLLPLALFIVFNGLDDLVIDAALLWHRFRKAEDAGQEPAAEEKRIAILVPLWNEAHVVGGMIRHNISAIRYARYDFFVGAYPNDRKTVRAVSELEACFPNVHLAVCPHDGPTSKADCLNWIYQRMLLFEEQHEARFQVIVTHDAEDLIHPDSLADISRWCGEYGMVQAPVLPLATPPGDIVHGIYCDEFAEYQTRDIPARQILGSYLPSNGVGTGFSRQALDRLAETSGNRIFEPECLTEDYENGLRIHRLKYRQKFLPLGGSRHPVATREYFPRTYRGAVRQRTRWIMGICLQSQERNGWRGNIRDIYWFWRDRKGLLTNPVSLLANVCFIWGLFGWAAARAVGGTWELMREPVHPALLAAAAMLAVYRAAIRMYSVSRYYGRRFAALVLIRTFCANYINAVATLAALWRYGRAKLLREPLVWLKTEHAYPSRIALLAHKRPLAEVLASFGYVAHQDLERALEVCGGDEELADFLLREGLLTETAYCEALSLQQGLPAIHIAPGDVEDRAVRTLPRAVVGDLHVLPFRVADGALFIATPRPPGEEVAAAVSRFTRLRVTFHLTTASNFRELEHTFGGADDPR